MFSTVISEPEEVESVERKIEKVDFRIPPKAQVKRVAAYARVSTEKDAMLHSLSAQISNYSSFIQKQPGWLYVGVYSDEALTGTKQSRPGFQQLLSDCRTGKIDLVITKSVSRFARNTVDLLAIVRELKLLGIDVFFEEQNIHTISAEGELMLTILASFAQEESLSASENQKWRVKKNFEAGIPCDRTLLGYRFEGDHYVIEPEEAETVRRIYDLYLSGKGVQAIANELNRDHVPTRFGMMTWHIASVQRILRNYTYTGNLLLQKTYREDHLTKKKRINTGQLPRFHVENAHEPIISMETFNEVQQETARRAKKYRPDRSKRKAYPFSGLIKCGCCGDTYRRKTTHAGPIWICKTYNTLGKDMCSSKAIPESILEQLTSNINLSELSSIRAESGNRVIFYFKTGESREMKWKDRSRSESWTDEMKMDARKHAMSRWSKEK